MFAKIITVEESKPDSAMSEELKRFLADVN
jgi:hypothetical protein